MTEVLETQTPPTSTSAVENTTQTTSAPLAENKELEQKLKELEAQKEHWRQKYERDIVNVPNQESAQSSEEAFSDEGKLLESKIKELQSDLVELKQDSAKKDLQVAHPVLKDKWSDFEEFRLKPENKGMNMRTAAKAYLVENGMYDTQRIGLEKSTGGTRTPLTSGMTADDVAKLRQTNYKKYRQLLEEGKLKIE